MATARRKQISLIDTKFYHCISRCARHTFLGGEDPYTGKFYDHRKKWVEDKLSDLVKIFCIDVCAYAVMNDHLHLVLHADDERAKKLSDKVVLTRWHKLFKGTEVTQKYLANEKMSKKQQVDLNETISLYRERLFDISWFMRLLKEHIARKANKEDGCTGRFWDCRFKTQALLDEASLVACMAYVDLNPIRAKLAKTPEGSVQSSIKKRIESANNDKKSKSLFNFVGEQKKSTPKGLPFELSNYLELVKLTGRSIRNGEEGIVDKTDPILEKLNIDPENWIALTTEFSTIRGPVGRAKAMQVYCDNLKIKRRTSLSQCRKLLN